MPFTKTLLPIFVLLLLSAVVEGRKCYECIGSDACKKAVEQECEKGVTGCGKLVWGGGLIKGCLSNNEDGSPSTLNSCIKDNSGGVEKTACGCQGKDLCNGGEQKGFVSAGLLVSALGLLRMPNF